MWDVARILAVAFAAVAFFSLLAIIGAHFWFPSGRPQTFQQSARNPLLLVPAQTLAYCVVVLAMASIARQRTRRSFLQAVRWNWPRRPWVFLLTGVGLSLAVELVSGFLPIPRSLPIEDYFRSAPAAYIMAIFGTTMAPLVEELFFRGFLYPVLARLWSGTLSLVVTAAAFALIHQGQLAGAWAPLLLLFIVGIALTMIRARTGSVAASTLTHVAYNATLFAILFVSTDGFRHLEKLG